MGRTMVDDCPISVGTYPGLALDDKHRISVIFLKRKYCVIYQLKNIQKVHGNTKFLHLVQN